MQTWKVVLAMGGLVLLGFLAGFYTNRALTKQKIERIAELRYKKGFEQRLLEIVDATSEQREILQPIIEKYAQANADAYLELRDNQRTTIEAMMTEIKPHLTTEQLNRLQRFERRFKGDHNRQKKDKRYRGKKDKNKSGEEKLEE